MKEWARKPLHGGSGRMAVIRPQSSCEAGAPADCASQGPKIAIASEAAETSKLIGKVLLGKEGTSDDMTFRGVPRLIAAGRILRRN